MGWKSRSTSLCAVLLANVLLASSGAAQEWDSKPRGDIDAGGDKTRRPVVFVHGIRGVGEQYERPALLFASNGYPATWVVAYDYNSNGASGGAAGLDKFIDDLRKRTGHDKVDLVGHSRGTAESKTYLRDPARAAKVAHFAHLAGGASDNAGGVPTLVVGSNGDRAFGEGRADGGAKHFVVKDQDHVKVCTSTETFEQVYAFVNDGQKPKTLKIEPQEELQVGGYVKTNGQNVPLPQAKVAVYEVAADSGKRLTGKPLVTLSVADDGQWGPFRAKPGQYYEFEVSDPSLAVPRHFYREPFVRSNRLVYFRLASKAANSSPSPLDTEPKYLTDKSSVFSVRHQNGGITPNKDSLKINGSEVATDAVFGGSTTTVVVLYALDGNENGKSDLTKVAGTAFSGSLTFTGAVDMFLPADPNGHVKFEYNGRTINVPAWKSSETGSVSVIFN